MKKRMVVITWIWAVVLAARIVTPLHAEAEKSMLRVMSYNIHRGGVVMLKQPLSQTAKGNPVGQGGYCRDSRDPFSQGGHLGGFGQVARLES